MIERLAKGRKSYIDVEVLQRLLKGLDFIVLGLGALTIAFGMTRISTPNNDALIGFFALELTFLCMLALCSPGLYEIASLRNGLRSIVLSIAACFAGAAPSISFWPERACSIFHPDGLLHGCSLPQPI